jgi:hypothetical protein
MMKPAESIGSRDGLSEGYEKVEQALPGGQLAPLEATCSALERGAMLHTALAIVRFYQELAIPLARTHGITYPTVLERVMYARLETLLDTV